MNIETQNKIEAAAFRSLVSHLQSRTDVQNIDLMNLAGFCRNCLSKWYMFAAQTENIDIDYDSAREHIYGMSYEEWKKNHQLEASDEQKELYEKSKPFHAKTS